MLLKRQLTLLSLLVLSAGLCAFATAQSFHKPETAGEILPAVEQKYTSYETAAYILREREGRVAVYSCQSGRLLEVTEIPVSSLRAGDRALLGEGIAADSKEALLTLLEDLNS